jgi:hypothetical protein
MRRCRKHLWVPEIRHGRLVRAAINVRKAPKRKRTVRTFRSHMNRNTSGELLPDRQLILNVAESLWIRLPQVLKQPFPLVHLHQESAPAGVVLLMRL